MTNDTGTWHGEKPKGKVRIWILVALFLAFLVAYFDRSNVSILIADKDFTDALGITGDKSSQGLFMTVFLLFYGMSCFFAGPIVERFGAKKVLGWSLALWALTMLVMGAVSSFFIILACRAVLGLGETVITPVSSKLIQTWIPVQERATANAVCWVAMNMGIVLSMPLIATLVAELGWRGSLFTLGAIGLLPVIFCYFYVYDVVSQHPKVTEEEAAYINAGRPEAAAPGEIQRSFGFLKNGNYWLVVIIYSVGMGSGWGITAWFPTYLKASLGFSWAAMGGLSALPYVTGAAGAALLAPAMDRLNARGFFTLVSMIGLTLMLYLTTVATSSAFAVATISLSYGFIAIASVALFTIMQNITSQKEVAVAAGFMTGISSVFASIFPFLMGVLYNATGSLMSAFTLLFSLGIVAIITAVPLWRRRL